jgi:predicted nucleic-acid-binding protein
MTGLDTNILVRFFAKDDPVQSGRVKELLRTLTPESPGFVSLVSFIELVWVLRGQYQMDKAELIQCMEKLVDSAELVVESQVEVSQALRLFSSSKADLADCLIERCGHHAGCRQTVTFDVKATKFAGMRLL